MSLKQCSAIKPSGERCKRVAAEGSDYCHSHRGYQPKVREPLPLGNRLVEHLLIVPTASGSSPWVRGNIQTWILA